MDGEKVFSIEGSDSSLAKAAVKTVDKQPFDVSTQEKFTDALNDKVIDKQPVQASQQLDARPNPLDVARDIYTQKIDSTHTVDNLNQNIQKVNDRIEEIKQTLESPDVTLKHSYQNVLENKLTHIDESLKVALNKVGIEFTEPAVAVAGGEGVGIQDAVHKFLSFLSNSQSKLQNVASEVKSFGDKSAHTAINPAELLSVQMKVSFVQQELELFANLLNKALESTKTVMNVQI